MKLSPKSPLLLLAGLVIGAGLGRVSRAQESPKMADLFIADYRKAAADPEYLRDVENRILSYPDIQAQTHLQLLQTEQNAQIIALLKRQAPQVKIEATPKTSPKN